MKILAGAGEKAEALLQSQLPRIRELFASKVGPALATAAKDDGKLKALSQTVYTVLPAVVRFAVKEDVFVKFCIAQRDKLIPLTTTPLVAGEPSSEIPAQADGPKSFFIAKDSEELGAMSVPAITKMLACGGLTSQDYFLDPEANEWIPLDRLPNFV